MVNDGCISGMSVIVTGDEARFVKVIGSPFAAKSHAGRNPFAVQTTFWPVAKCDEIARPFASRGTVTDWPLTMTVGVVIAGASVVPGVCLLALAVGDPPLLPPQADAVNASATTALATASPRVLTEYRRAALGTRGVMVTSDLTESGEQQGQVGELFECQGKHDRSAEKIHGPDLSRCTTMRQEGGRVAEERARVGVVSRCCA